MPGNKIRYITSQRHACIESQLLLLFCICRHAKTMEGLEYAGVAFVEILSNRLRYLPGYYQALSSSVAQHVAYIFIVSIVLRMKQMRKD